MKSGMDRIWDEPNGSRFPNLKSKISNLRFEISDSDLVNCERDYRATDGNFGTDCLSRIFHRGVPAIRQCSWRSPGRLCGSARSDPWRWVPIVWRTLCFVGWESDGTCHGKR